MKPDENDTELLTRLIEGECSAGEIAVIGRRLQSEPGLRALYRRTCDFEASAAIVMREREDIVDFPVSPAKESKLRRILVVSASAAILLVGLILFLGKSGSKPEHIKLTFGDSARLEEGEKFPVSLSPGKLLSLEKGNVHLAFQEGKANATVRAPARFSFGKDGSLHVEEGWYALELGPGSEPLRCTVGEYLIEDIGTSYSFVASKGTLQEISVTEGSVRLTSGPGSEPQIVKSGSGLRISQRGFVPFQIANGPPSSEILFE